MSKNITTTIERLSPQGVPLPPEIQVFSTCPSSAVETGNYLEKVIRAARWSEDAGCTGILVYTDNSLVDPWLVSQAIVECTDSLAPLVAVQPAYMHPYSVAKMVSSIASLYGRRVFLNMVAGGFKTDLAALGDSTPHDARYERLIEYTRIIRRLLEGRSPVTLEGRFYRTVNLVLKPPVPPELLPGILISGSSEAGLEASRAIGATAVKYPEPPDQCSYDSAENGNFGVRVGIIARENGEDAWEIALERFPEDRQGQLTHKLAMKVSDSVWHKKLSQIGSQTGAKREVYWLGPFENYKTFCPYLVGSYQDVSFELGRYMSAGFKTYILDIPASKEDLEHISKVFRMAAENVHA